MPKTIMTASLRARVPIWGALYSDITKTPIVEHWPEYSKKSKWFFLTTEMEKIYLQYGCNTFGNDSRNNIEIQDPSLKLVVMEIFMLEGDRQLPSLHDIHGLIEVNRRAVLAGRATRIQSGEQIVISKNDGAFFMSLRCDEFN